MIWNEGEITITDQKKTKNRKRFLGKMVVEIVPPI